jgi:hypothetical protein
VAKKRADLLAKKKEKERKNVSLLPFPPIIKY